jgi:hypothetical protein
VKVELFAPPEYWRLTDEERSQFRCGPGRGVLEWLVPETMYGLTITPACAIHDFSYRIGQNDQDKTDADDVFLNNMVRIIEAHTNNKILLCLRLRRAKTYYQMVKQFGGVAFWSGKNLPSEMGLVLI